MVTTPLTISTQLHFKFFQWLSGGFVQKWCHPKLAVSLLIYVITGWFLGTTIYGQTQFALVLMTGHEFLFVAPLNGECVPSSCDVVLLRSYPALLSKYIEPISMNHYELTIPIAGGC